MGTAQVPSYLLLGWKPEDMLGCAEAVVCSVGLKPWSFPLGRTHIVSGPEGEGLVGKR